MYDSMYGDRYEDRYEGRYSRYGMCVVDLVAMIDVIFSLNQILLAKICCITWWQPLPSFVAKSDQKPDQTVRLKELLGKNCEIACLFHYGYYGIESMTKDTEYMLGTYTTYKFVCKG